MSIQSFEVRVIAASVNKVGEKIATLVCRYPRFIHSELMTHKDLSRNASSSRAVPFKKMLKLTRKDMAAPIHWGANQPGMQANEELTGLKYRLAILMWHLTGHIVLTLAWLMSFTGVHKQVINRMIEPWTYINVQITATNWDRMLKLRLDPAAQPEFRHLAKKIQYALERAWYVPLAEGEWHVPWVTADEMQSKNWPWLLRISAARSARQSYTPIGEAMRNAAKDERLALDLLKQLHLSPFEHQATPKEGRHANFVGWQNQRTMLGY